MVSHVEQQIQARIERVKREQAERKRQRAELDEARVYGLQARRTAKLKRQQQGDQPA